MPAELIIVEFILCIAVMLGDLGKVFSKCMALAWVQGSSHASVIIRCMVWVDELMKVLSLFARQYSQYEY